MKQLNGRANEGGKREGAEGVGKGEISETGAVCLQIDGEKGRTFTVGSVLMKIG